MPGAGQTDLEEMNEELKSTFAIQLEQDCCTIEPGVMKALRSWFIVHVVRSDREFAEHLRRRHRQGPAGSERQAGD